jgi:chromosome segregation ATPase
MQGAHGKIIVLEKDISSLRMQLKSQRHQFDTLETVIKDNRDCISRFETVNQAMETELEKCQKKLVDSKMNYAVEQKQMQRIADSQIAVLQTRVNELEQSNTELTHQMTDLQCLIKKQKHDHILVLEQTIREGQSTLLKYRNDNTKLVVQVSNSEDLISSQEKSLNAEILRLQNECETYHQDSINWRNEANLMTSLVSRARASEESLKSSLMEAESKIVLIEGIKRDLEGKLNDEQQELSIMKDKNRILEERQCLLAHKCSSLQEQLQALQNAYDEDRIQMKTSFDDDRVRLQEDYRNKVSHYNYEYKVLLATL